VAHEFFVRFRNQARQRIWNLNLLCSDSIGALTQRASNLQKSRATYCIGKVLFRNNRRKKTEEEPTTQNSRYIGRGAGRRISGTGPPGCPWPQGQPRGQKLWPWIQRCLVLAWKTTDLKPIPEELITKMHWTVYVSLVPINFMLDRQAIRLYTTIHIHGLLYSNHITWLCSMCTTNDLTSGHTEVSLFLIYSFQFRSAFLPTLPLSWLVVCNMHAHQKMNFLLRIPPQ